MRKLAGLIVKYRKFVAISFVVMMIFSVFSLSWVNIEEDITNYLPSTTDAKQGLDIMNREVESYASGEVIVRDIDEEKAEELSTMLLNLDGVMEVSFDSTSKSYYNKNKAKYSITFEGEASSKSAQKGYKNVKNLIKKYDATIVSESFSSEMDDLMSQMVIVLIFVVIIVIVVLVFTSSNYGEVIVYLATFLAAALINMGTNFFMGTISYVSYSVAVVLQLALSVDYAIILCNRYKEEHENKPVKEAVELALAYSIPAISSSSLTTIAGLAAMTFMQFQLGLDMGIALIKAIIISLLSVFLFMPCLLCFLGNWMDKTKHKNFIPKVDFLGKFAYKTRHIIPPLFVALVAFAYISFGNVKYDNWGDLVYVFNESEERTTDREITDTFGDDNMIALLVPTGDYEKENELVDNIKNLPNIIDVTSLSSIEAMNGYCLGDSVTYREFMNIAGLDETTSKALFAYYAADNEESSKITDIETYKAPIIKLFKTAYTLTENGKVSLSDSDKKSIQELYETLKEAEDQLQGKNYDVIAISNKYATEGTDTKNFIESLKVLAGKYYDSSKVYITGDQVSAKDFGDTFKSDMEIVGLLSIVLVMLILLITFKSFVMPLLLIVVIQGSIWINFAIAAWTGQYVFFMCYLIVSSIQMGANIDYAIVISTRYNDMRALGMSPKDSIIKTLNLAFPTVITSGTMMVFSGAMIAFRISQYYVAGMGQFIATGTIITLLLVNFVLPQILVLGDSLVRSTTIHFKVPRILPQLFKVATITTIIGALVLGGGQLIYITSEHNNAVNSYNSLIKSVDELSDIADGVDEDIDDVKYKFAESYVTNNIGTTQLNEGQSEYDAGSAELSEAKSEYNSGNEQYQEGLEEYAAAKQQLAEGQAQYDAGESEYQAGLAQLAEGQAQYDAGEAELAAAQATYDSGQSQLNAIQPIYALVYPLYTSYKTTEAEYNAAVASGDTETASSLQYEYEAEKALFETTLSSTGYSISQLISEYEAGQAELAEGAAQIAAAQAELDAAKQQLDEGQAQLDAAKAQLDDAKAQLDDGYAQLAAAEQELAEAKQELDSGASQISDGENELNAAAVELANGRQQLDDNYQNLLTSMDKINDYDSDIDKLNAGLNALYQIDELYDIISDDAGYKGTFTAAKLYFEKKIETENSLFKSSFLSMGFLFMSAILCVIAMVLNRINRETLSRWISFASIIIGLFSALIWKMNCMTYGYTVLLLELLIVVIWIVHHFMSYSNKNQISE